MAGNGKDDPPSGRPHVWSFATVTLAAAIGAAASIVVAVQKGRYDDDRHDLEARIRNDDADRELRVSFESRAISPSWRS